MSHMRLDRSVSWQATAGQVEPVAHSGEDRVQENRSILVVGTSDHLLGELHLPLLDEGFAAHQVATIQEAQQDMLQCMPGIVIVELVPPDYTQLGLSAAIRCNSSFDRVSIFFVVPEQLNDELVQLECLTSGADDVLTLPYHVPVVIARLKAVARICRTQVQCDATSEIGGLRVDHRQRKVWADQQEVYLTPSEYEILRRLLQSPGRTFDRSELIGTSRPSDPLASTRTIDVHVYSLRRKLGSLGELIETVKGEGYCIFPAKC